ncbi:hypothetical protein [Streptomyces noursei]|uniref:hypothetical protein n=1 Tax=Streptomyces noursei TaxID=1971 RepID=UPI0023B826C4|nr:hypothetical protein [Streptomyces noursei]
MTEPTDASTTAEEPAVRPPAAGAPVEHPTGGRELAVGTAMLASVVGVVSALTGALLAVVNLTGHTFGAWRSPESLSHGLIGAAMLGVTPGLFAVGRARAWEEVRTLLLPLVVVLVGLFAVGVRNGGELQAVRGGPLFLVLFSLGWVAVLGLLGLSALLCLLRQYLKPARPRGERGVPLPGWSKPVLAVLGSAWFGIGAGLLALPGFWADFVPWTVGRADAQALGVWALALGIGVLGSLAEDDLDRTRPALLALPGVALAVTVELAVHATRVHWGSGGGLALLSMVGGLLVAGVTGRWLLARGPASGRMVEGQELRTEVVDLT